MKAIVISLLAVLLMLPLSVNAVDKQAKSKYKTRYGLKAGLGITDISGDVQDKYPTPASKTGFVIGGFALMRVNEFLYIQPEILHAKKGAKAKDPNRRLKLNLTYLEFPVLARLYALPKASVRPHLFFGPAPSIKLSAVFNVDGRDVIDAEDVTLFDFGVVVGGGFDITSGKGILMIEGRYTRGVISIDDTRDKLNLKNDVVLFTVGYAF